MAGPLGWKAWEPVDYSLRTGQPAAHYASGQSLFDVVTEDPDAAKRLSETMITVHGAEPPFVADAYDFSAAGIIVDVGGARGDMLARARMRCARLYVADLMHRMGGTHGIYERSRLERHFRLVDTSDTCRTVFEWCGWILDGPPAVYNARGLLWMPTSRHVIRLAKRTETDASRIHIPPR